MMKYAFAICLALFASRASAQSQSAQSLSSQSLFEQELIRQLAQDPHADYDYSHSDAYRSGANYRAQRAVDSILGLTESDLAADDLVADTGSRDVSNDKADQEETTIAISRRDPNLIIAGSNDGNSPKLGAPVYVSQDGGKSWHTYRLPALPDDRLASGDPMIAAAADGRFYYAYLTIPKYTAFPIQVLVAVSNNGIDWTNMQVVDTTNANGYLLQDKPTIVVDNSSYSPYFGRVYVVWTVTTDVKPGVGLRLSYSDDHGATWSPAQVLTSEMNHLFAQVSTGRNGEIAVSYSSYNDAVHQVLISTDGAKTFVTKLIAHHVAYPYNSSNNYSLKGLNGPRAYPYCSTRLDMSNTRLHAVYGTWTTWPDKVASSELFYAASDDLGDTWSSPVPIFGASSDQSSFERDRFFPWLAYDELTHQTSLVYYSSELDSVNRWTRPYRAVIGPNGPEQTQTLIPNSFDPLVLSSHFLGDYIGCDAYANLFAAAWAQNRPEGTDADVFAIVLTTDSTKSDVHALPVKLNASEVTLSDPYPNPSSGKIALSFTLPASGPVSIDLISTDGIVVHNLLSEVLAQGSYVREIDVSHVAAGSYFIRLSTSAGSTLKKLTRLPQKS